MASDLISREALKEEMVKDLANTMRMTEMHKGDMAVRVLNKIDEAPAVDSVEVVRCRDCVNWQSDWAPTRGSCWDHYCGIIDLVTAPDFFCGCGEREVQSND